MPEATPKITVIVAAYRPGDGILRVIDSLDAQTLPQDEFETIIVDDGSPDDTFERLERFAATRPNLRVTRIENSGWPSRPRNIATRMARSEYVLFMDHDDSLYPDALRRSVEYARETRADLLSPKESKTSDVWWGMPALADGNIADVKADGGIDRLLPMVPHKVYRREFLLERDITFPEGRRMLWEDIYLNVEAYAKAERVAVLADTPVYLWHSSATNNSKTYGPKDEEFWDRLDDLLRFIDAQLVGPELADARQATILHQYRTRVLGRLGKALQSASGGQAALAIARARAVQDAYVPEAWDDLLGALERPRARLLREGRGDLLRSLHDVHGAIVGRTTATHAAWADGVLEVHLTSRWQQRDGSPLVFDRDGDRILVRLPQPLTDALPPEFLDVTDRTDRYSLAVGARARSERITWQLPAPVRIEVESLGAREVGIAAHAVARLDPETAALGKPLAATVWDLAAVTRWEGLSRGSALRTDTPARPALLAGRPAVAYRNQSGNLTVDLAQRLRSVIKDGGTPVGAVAREGDGVVLPLPTVTVVGATALPIVTVFGAVDAQEPAAAAPVAEGTLIGEAGSARLHVRGLPEPGRYRLSFRTEQSTLMSALLAVVRPDGRVTLESRPLPAPVVAGKPAPKRRSLLTRVLGRIDRWRRTR